MIINSICHCYRQTIYPLNPHIVDIDRFETQLGRFLQNLSDDTEYPQYEVPDAETTNPTWLALLFVILASGIQYSDRPRDERQSKSKAYGECREDIEAIISGMLILQEQFPKHLIFSELLEYSRIHRSKLSRYYFSWWMSFKTTV